MFFLKFIIFLCVFAVTQLVLTESALAWGPGVHTAIALFTLANVDKILPSIAAIITSFPIEYVYGSLAADFFVGKTKGKKTRHLHNWEGGLKFLNEANDAHDAAYAYGFLSHLAADVIGHNFFIPNLIMAYPIRRGMGHLYWEMKADYLVGPGYTSVAKTVLNMDHHGCDELLKMIMEKRLNGLGTKKRIFTQSVKFSSYAFATQRRLFQGRVVHRQVPHKYLAFMLDLSCRLVENFLSCPETSVCLLCDPLGIRNLGIAKRKRSFTRLANSRRAIKPFIVDQELLNL